MSDECFCETSPPEFGGRIPDPECPLHGRVTTQPTPPLPARIEAAIERTEAVARAATHQKVAGPSHGHWNADSAALMAGGILDAKDRAHIALNDPEVTLRRVAADRQILEHHPTSINTARAVCLTCWDARTSGHATYPCPTLRALASQWDGEPGWQEVTG